MSSRHLDHDPRETRACACMLSVVGTLGSFPQAPWVHGPP